jgi:hypothetical protein
MILLEKDRYKILIEPLKKIPINISFVHSVIEKSVSGKVYVDNIEEPSTFYILHPYGLSLLYGNSRNEDFNNSFKEYALNTNAKRIFHEWMQAYPSDWDMVLNQLFREKIIKSTDNIDNLETGVIELNTRVNFKFNYTKYLNRKQRDIIPNVRMIQTDEHIFRDMKGNVIPLNFWDSAEDFIKNGIGFSLFFDNKLASTAYSACIQKNKMEIGIETIAEFQGKGFAVDTCSKLIEYCLNNGYEPVWSCRLENIGSYKLAQKLGFEPTLELPFYRLSK